MTSADLYTLLPELLLALYALCLLLYGVYSGKDALTGRLSWLSALVLGLLALWVGLGSGARAVLGGAFIDDGLARFAKVVIALSAATVLVMSVSPMRLRRLSRFEFPVLVLLACVGMMIMVSAGNLLLLFIGAELQALALYVLANFKRENVRSSEAGMKYLVLGGLSSALLLYGASLIYGFSGSIQFESINQGLQQAPMGRGLLIGLILVLVGLAFKLALAPFHMWAPDVYEGSPTPITAFLASAPMIAAIALCARLLHVGFGAAAAQWGPVLALLSLVSMFAGAIAAIGQSDIKRLLAYSAIAHMGFALMALAAGSETGVQAMLIYLTLYLVMILGCFAFVLTMKKEGAPVTQIAALNMFAKSQPLRAAAMLVLLGSLAGLPPLAGFLGKLYVLLAAVEAGMVWLAVAGVIASVVLAFSYLRVVYLMYFGDEVLAGLHGRVNPILWGVTMLAALAMLFGVINLFGLETPALAAAQSLVR